MKRKCNIDTKWSPTLAYVLGIIATDGNLSPDKRHINVTSKDKTIVEQIKKALKIKNKIGRKAREKFGDKKYYVLQFGDVNFYEFLLSIGITPAKSKTISTIKIPKKLFYDFFRGCIDGDGNISISYHPESKIPQLKLRLCSASNSFLIWILEFIRKNTKINGGWIYTDKKQIHTLNFGKKDSIKIFELIYYEGVEFFLKRKYDVALGICTGGEIGTRTCLRSKRSNPWRFKSSPVHK